MNIAAVENVISLLVSIIGLLSCLFRYIETPRKGWMFLSLFYLSCLMSDYYWATYTLVMHTEPDQAPLIASFGWNISILFLYIIILNTQNPKAKGFFHPMMLIPIPVNILLFLLCSRYWGLVNNLWQCIAATVASFIMLRSILYWFKNRKEGAHFPHLSSMLLIYIFCQMGIWFFTAQAADTTSLDPYDFFVFLSFLPLLLFSEATRRDLEAEGLGTPEKSSYEIGFHIAMQALVSLLIIGGCAGGYFIASSLRDSLPADGSGGLTGTVVSVTLFVISVFMVLVILIVIFIIASRNRKKPVDDGQNVADNRRSSFNLVFTLLITLILMAFTVAYNAKLLFTSSTERIYGMGQERASATALDLENYLSILKTALWATADTVEMMIEQGESQDKIRTYLVEQTKNRKFQFDENFTGLYGSIRGEYMDGTEWVPPEGYVAESRDWYKKAVEAKGNIEIVSPYVDAQTHSVVITVTKLLGDGGKGSSEESNVIALDVMVDHIQEIMEEQNIAGKGYGMVVDRDGLIIAHQNPEYNGKNISEIYGDQLRQSILDTKSGKVSTVINEEQCTMFLSSVLDQWSVVIVIKNSELFDNLQNQVLVNIIISLVMFFLISFFYYLSYKNEQAYNKKMEEMNINRQKQEYEAEVLRLEKLASDEANKAKGSFLADMSHEIRTPINAILGMNEMILREERDPSIREYANNIGTSGKNLLQLINSILDFSKIEDGKMEIVPVRYHLSEMVTYLINSIYERANTKGLEFIVNVDPTLPSELYGDDARLNQVMINLLTNAVKYTREGSVTLNITSAEVKDGNVLMRVEVRDTGIGIKESDMDKLFESFERLDLEKNRNIEGTGLGMSITTKLLKLMDSELKVESVYGEGSVFSFEVWQKIENDKPLGDYKMLTSEEDAVLSYTESFHAPDAHILIVDDTKMNLMVATGLLKNTEIAIDTAMSGADAIVLSDENLYDMIFLDQRMPEMDGTETLKRIRESEKGKNKETPVICLTADAITGAKERYIAEGFTDYLTKPIDSRSLEQLLIHYLPADKVIEISEETGTEAERVPAGESGIKAETAAKAESCIDRETALKNLGGDPEFYNSILAEYARDHGDRSGKLKEFYGNSDWENYKINIHALKSSSKTIGAFILSDLAAGLEKAALEEDITVLQRDHDTAMDLYDSVVSDIRDSIDVDKYASDDDIWEG